MSEIATITRQRIPCKNDKSKKFKTSDCNFLMSSIGWTLNSLEKASSLIKLIQGKTYTRACFVLRFPNGEEEIFPYTNAEIDKNSSVFETIRYNESLQEAVNYALSKNFNVEEKYISLFSSGKIEQLILRK